MSRPELKLQQAADAPWQTLTAADSDQAIGSPVDPFMDSTPINALLDADRELVHGGFVLPRGRRGRRSYRRSPMAS